MPTQAEILNQVSELLKAGEPQQAADLIAQHKAETVEQGAASAAPTAEPAAPRAPNHIIHDFMAAVAAHLGSHPALEKLVEEFRQVL